MRINPEDERLKEYVRFAEEVFKGNESKEELSRLSSVKKSLRKIETILKKRSRGMKSLLNVTEIINSLEDHEKLLSSILDSALELVRRLAKRSPNSMALAVGHGDFQPGNILVGEDGVPKLLDFGIAKLLDPSSFPEAVEQTRTGVRPMSLAYASPEQIRGQTITTASDIYSLGVLLYRLLAGRLPRRFEGMDPEAVARALGEDPTLPSVAVLEAPAPAAGESDRVWIVDPLDGTNNYAHGYPFFSVAVAIEEKGSLFAGVVYDPLRDEMFVAEREAGGARFSIIVVSEGAHPRDGERTVQLDADQSATGYPRLGGVGVEVGRIIEERMGIECRVTVLGHVQRGGSPSSRDRYLGTRFGVGAVDMIEAGKSGHMVALRGEAITHVPFEDVIGRPKLVNPEGEEVRAMEAVGVSFGR